MNEMLSVKLETLEIPQENIFIFRLIQEMLHFILTGHLLHRIQKMQDLVFSILLIKVLVLKMQENILSILSYILILSQESLSEVLLLQQMSL